MAKTGRRPVLDEAKQSAICAIVAMGCSRQTAAQYVGCAVATIRKTALRDARFADKLRKSEHGWELKQLTNIQAAAERSWQAAAWLLERRLPETYSKRDPKQVNGQHLARLVARFAEVVAGEVREAGDRRRVLDRLSELASDLERAVDAPQRRRETGR
ncbi:MAG: hypothetical protein K1X74_00615 [Pirellulales bacterium]|nr:hypothetical protein [Pirellulales bacterium]